MQTSTPSPLLGRIAFIAACAGTVLGPLHALARFATHDGAGDLKSPFVHWWAVPAGHTFGWLVRWGSADTVYLTYGKLLAPVAIAATVFAFAVRRSRTPVGLERWGWPIALTGYVLASAAVLGEYWTPWLDQSFMFLALPGILVSLIVLNSVVAMSAALIPMLWAWGVAGRAASRRAVPSEPVPVA